MAKKLAGQKTLIVGTIRKNKRELWKDMTKPSEEKSQSSRFLWNQNSQAMFVKYQPKRKKSVCLLSTLHRSGNVVHSTIKKKPKVILFCNKNKTSVDCFHQMACLYWTRSASQRWPLSVWANMLDIVAINAWILYRKPTNKGISIRNFLLELIDALRHKQIEINPKIPAPACNQLLSRKRKKYRGSDGCANATVSLCIICKEPTCGKYAVPD